jgi:hypothetical protein
MVYSRMSIDISRDPLFWARVDLNGPIPPHRPDLGPCWVWTGPLREDGYAHLKRGHRMQKVHVIAYQLGVGPVPRETPDLDHLCRIRHCVNYERHLEPVTHAENVRRAKAAITECPGGHPLSGENLIIDAKTGARRCRTCRNAQGKERKERARRAAGAHVGPMIGEIHPRAQLTEDDVRTIRAAGETQKILADRFGVSISLIGAIKRGAIWKHVT